MRTWLHRHPNAAVIALGAWMLWNAFWVLYWLNRHAWPWTALSALCVAMAVQPFIAWWKRT